MVAQGLIPALRRKRQKVLPELGQPGLHGEFQASKDYIVKPLLNNNNNNKIGLLLKIIH